jgi:hypothetical protein
MGVGIALADMEQQHEELVQDVATEKEESACWLEVERMKYEVAVVMESVQAAAVALRAHSAHSLHAACHGASG